MVFLRINTHDQRPHTNSKKKKFYNISKICILKQLNFLYNIPLLRQREISEAIGQKYYLNYFFFNKKEPKYFLSVLLLCRRQ